MSAEISLTRSRRRARDNGRPYGARGTRSKTTERPKPGFVLYVEGPRDRDLLRIWAHRVSRGLAKALDGRVVILGGRRPARAVEHFRDLRGESPEMSGLVVLDRDDLDGPTDLGDEPGLEFFMWERRHIESYMLVPSAIKRAAGGGREDSRIDRVLAEHLPSENDPRRLRDLDAKRLLAGKGPLARALGCALTTPDIAKCMRREDIHGEVLGLLDRLSVGFGLKAEAPAIVVRERPR